MLHVPDVPKHSYISDIYASRFVDAIKFALASIAEKAALKNKMDLLGENQ